MLQALGTLVALAVLASANQEFITAGIDLVELRSYAIYGGLALALGGLLLSFTEGGPKNRKAEALLAATKTGFVRDYGLKVQTFMLCSPDEVLKALLDESTRANWDFGLRRVSYDESLNEITLAYSGGMGSDGTVKRDFVERVQVSYLVFEQKFFIIE